MLKTFTHLSQEYPRGHSNISVVHMHNQRNAKKGSFFETEHESGESWLGQNLAVFMKKGSF